MKLKSLVLTAAALLFALSAGAIDIIDLHANTSTGVATMLGQVVTVDGVITVPGGGVRGSRPGIDGVGAAAVVGVLGRE